MSTSHPGLTLALALLAELALRDPMIPGDQAAMIDRAHPDGVPTGRCTPAVAERT